jgi:RNA ligase
MSTFEPPHLYDLVRQDELQWLTINDYLREAQHPTEPLALLNYTDRAQTKPELFDQVPSLNLCRGLIYNTTDGTVAARPFHKFWNYGQAQAAKIGLNDTVTVTDKVDGSLGIMYREPSSGKWAIATRGSFDSEQALHATKLLQTRYDGFEPADLEYTLLFEIVYPDNRIVVDYGLLDDLILLGSVSMKDGTVIGATLTHRTDNWPGLHASEWEDQKLGTVLAAPPRPNAEGFVLRRVMTNDLVKVKQEDYLELHRIVFGLSTRRIYEAVVAGRTLEDILAPLPDEFHAWTTAVHNELYAKFRKRHNKLIEQYATTMAWAHKGGMCGLYEDESGHEWTVDRSERKEIAQLFSELDDPWAMFALLDDREIAPKIWKELEPPAGQLPSNYTPKEA